MIEKWMTALSLVATVSGMSAPQAHATDLVTYEVVSDSIPFVDVEYLDQTGRHQLLNVPLPWRLDVGIDDARASTGFGAQVRADWRPSSGPGKWVVATIASNGKVLCQNTLDVGDVTCYGNTFVVNGYLDPKTVPLP